MPLSSPNSAEMVSVNSEPVSFSAFNVCTETKTFVLKWAANITHGPVRGSASPSIVQLKRLSFTDGQAALFYLIRSCISADLNIEVCL